MHTYKVYFILQTNQTSDATFESNLDIEQYHEQIKQRGYILAILRGMWLLIPFHAITGILEGTV